MVDGVSQGIKTADNVTPHIYFTNVREVLNKQHSIFARPYHHTEECYGGHSASLGILLSKVGKVK